MNVKRFTARTSREALALVRQAFGDDAVVMSTRPCPEGVEVLAMAPESVQQLERVGASIPAHQPPRAAAPAAPAASATIAARTPAAARPAAPRADARLDRRTEPRMDVGADLGVERGFETGADNGVERDVEQMQMSTLSFQDYVRERMLKRRQAELAAAAPAPVPAKPPVVASIESARSRPAAARMPEPPVHRDLPVLRQEIRLPEPMLHAAAAPALAEPAPRRDQTEMLDELRSMRGLIEQRFGALAFMEKLQRQPRQATLTQKLLDAGFSPSLIRKLVDSLPAEVDESAWAAGVLERNLLTGEREPALEDMGGVFAMVGATGVGKTTSTAKLAAAFATRHGAANLGLITLDAYRVGAHEQLRTYGRILGVPVHTAHDRASLEDLLELLAGKKMVLIDTAGMAQRDARTRELLEMLSHRAINRLLVVNAASQGETIEEVLAAYGAHACRGIVISKMDEAVKLGPALDAMIRHKLKVLAVANGQRVPEDWHRLSANTLVQRALRGGGSAAWRMDSADMNLVFAGGAGAAGSAALHA
jgi:flagellar biosynthesis protein FlhF